ncbi:MAG: FHA domain-containing protein [Bacillota bacterium]
MGRTTVEQSENQYVVMNKLTKPEAINERELDAIARGFIESLIPVQTEMGKKGIVIKSSVEGMISLQSYFNSLVSKKMFLGVVDQLVAIVKECEKNHMNVSNLMLDEEAIFLDPRTKKIKCIFWPMVNNQNGYSVREFFKELPFRVVFTKHEEHDYVRRYMNYFREQTTFSINSFEKLIFELLGKKVENKSYLPSGSTSFGERDSSATKTTGATGASGNIAYNPLRPASNSNQTKTCSNCGQECVPGGRFCSNCGSALTQENIPSTKEKDEIASPQAGAGTQPYSETTLLGSEDFAGTTVLGGDAFEEPSYPYLIREKTQEIVSVDKPSFRIGKESKFCDYFISNNNAISRSHADILTKENRYYIIDHNSTNKTYVDGKVVPVEKQVEIFSGSKIKLANEDFVFYL